MSAVGCCRAEAAVSLRLLLEALGDHPSLAVAGSGGGRADQCWLSLEEWGGLLGAARQNSVQVQLPSPAVELRPILQGWLRHGGRARPVSFPACL
jgi:hypothetical protein